MLLPDNRNPTCSALLSPSQCKMSLAQQKNPICQVRNTNRVGKTESLLLPLPWVRHMLGWGPSGACAAALRGSIPQLVLGTHGGGTGLLVQLRVRYPCPCAGHISRHKPAPCRNSLLARSKGHLSHSVWGSSGRAVPAARPAAPPRCCGTPARGGRALSLRSHTSCWQECQSSHFQGRQVERCGSGADM